MNRRDQIKLTDAELAAFLHEQRTVIVATNGSDGFPHLMPLWYVLRPDPDGGPLPRLWGWTFAKSQKVRNLERDDRVTLQVEAGEQYAELRGVMIKAHCVVHRELELVTGIGLELTRRYGGGDLPPDAEEAFRRQAAKRVGFEFVAQSYATWDHRKLGGTY